MTFALESAVSRRRFLASASLAAMAAWFAPHRLLAEEIGLVQQIRGEAAVAKIAVQPLRGKVSALIGSGGNIGVLPGRDGKLLIDAGITASRPRITEAWPPSATTPSNTW